VRRPSWLLGAPPLVEKRRPSRQGRQGLYLGTFRVRYLAAQAFLERRLQFLSERDVCKLFLFASYLQQAS
jgi:hypothetical protein